MEITNGNIIMVINWMTGEKMGLILVKIKTVKPIKSKMLKVLDRERKKTQEELDKYYHKMKDTESYWGFNGPYARQEKAYEKRESSILKKLNVLNIS